jgi:hypothetical protein
VPDGLAATILSALQVERADVEADLRRGGPFDAVGLATLGIDLQEVRRQAEETFGPARRPARRPRRGGGAGGHNPVPSGRQRRRWSWGCREAVRLGHGFIGTEHLLLGLLHDGRARDGARRRGGVGLERRPAALVEELVRKRQAGEPLHARGASTS